MAAMPACATHQASSPRPTKAAALEPACAALLLQRALVSTVLLITAPIFQETVETTNAAVVPALMFQPTVTTA